MEENFPKISAKNLEGDSLELPHDLEGTLNILIIAFRREQQSLVDDWIPYLEAYVKKNLRISYYEIPTIHFSYLPLRWMIDGGMRAGIADKKARQRTITLYINKKKFKKHLDIEDESTIHIFLINEDGKIIWKTDGNITKDKTKSLEETISKILS
jgi:hypothetical protein